MTAIVETKSERTRARIVARVAPLFNRKGYAGTSLSDMTEAAGLTKGAIYGNFDGKDEVALHAFRHNIGGIIAELEGAVRSRDRCADKLRAYTETYRRIYPAIAAGGGCPLANTLCDADDTHPGLRAEAGRMLARWRDTIARIVARGIASGECAPSADPRRAAMTIITLIEGGALLAAGARSADYFMNALDRVDDYIDALCRHDDGGAPPQRHITTRRRR
ncbi:MAG TPA: TetR/AcrR family transcriptional regulator [Spirochaetota bacterium]|nr:TetR/AcrR family transcriptional regulator [Spirochaetota bacterium]